MALPKTGRYGKLKVPLNDGVQYSNVELTLQNSKTIGGKAYTSRFYAHSASPDYWNGNPEKKATFRLQGIIGEGSVVPGASNDEVSVPDNISYFKDNASTTPLTATADTSISVGSRPAASKAAWYLLTLDNAAGTFSCVKGPDISGTRTALLDTFADVTTSAAGTIPLISAGKTLVCGVQLDTTTSTTLDAADIVYTDSTGVLLQERSDIPSGQENLLEGGILFGEALLVCHLGPVTRKVYATFHSQKEVLADVADLINWKTSTSQNVVTMPGKGDSPSRSEIGGAEVTTGSTSQYMVGRKMFDLFRKKIGYVQLFQDVRDLTAYFEAACSWSSIDENNDEAAIVNNLAFTVNGFMERRGTE